MVNIYSFHSLTYALLYTSVFDLSRGFRIFIPIFLKKYAQNVYLCMILMNIHIKELKITAKKLFSRTPSQSCFFLNN